MSTEREMTEAAARAIGIELEWFEATAKGGADAAIHDGEYWKPRKDDGDSFRLAAALRISVEHNSDACRQPWVRARIDVSAWEAKIYQEDVPDESQRADRMRLAILRCAAAQAPKEVA